MSDKRVGRGRDSVRLRLRRLAAVVTLFTAAVGAVGVSGYVSLNRANANENRLGTAQALVLESLAQQHTLRAQAWFAIAATGGGTNRPLSEVRTEFATAQSRLQAVNDELTGIISGTPYSRRFAAVHESEDEIVRLTENIISLSTFARPQALTEVDRLEDIADAADVQISALAADLTAERTRRLADAGRLVRTDSERLIVAAVLAAALAFILAAWLSRSILKPLREVADVAERIGTGDLDSRCARTGKAEIDVVVDALNSTADKLSVSMRHLAAEARRERVGSHLTEAFDMAETENDTYEVVSRALNMVDPARPAELLLADNSRARLRRQATSTPDEPPNCPVQSPFSCVAVRRGHATVFDDSDALNACPNLKGRPAGQISAVCVPVTFMGRSLGVLHTTGPAGQRPEEETIAALSMVAGQTGSRIGTLRSFAQAQLQASTDGLTGLRNRRAFESDVRELLLRGERAALVIADLDKFKVLNDTYGHEAGDRALRVFGETLRLSLREQDLAGRIGGEEFSILLHDVSPDEAAGTVERLRAGLAHQGNGSTPRFTASFGISCTDGHTSYEELFRQADQALYHSKHEGRDRITIADHPAYGPVPAHEMPAPI